VPRKGVLGCEKPYQEDAVAIMLNLSFTWLRYSVNLVISPLPPPPHAVAEIAASTSREAVAWQCGNNFPGGPL